MQLFELFEKTPCHKIKYSFNKGAYEYRFFSAVEESKKLLDSLEYQKLGSLLSKSVISTKLEELLDIYTLQMIRLEVIQSAKPSTKVNENTIKALEDYIKNLNEIRNGVVDFTEKLNSVLDDIKKLDASQKEYKTNTKKILKAFERTKSQQGGLNDFIQGVDRIVSNLNLPERTKDLDKNISDLRAGLSEGPYHEKPLSDLPQLRKIATERKTHLANKEVWYVHKAIATTVVGCFVPILLPLLAYFMPRLENTRKELRKYNGYLDQIKNIEADTTNIKASAVELKKVADELSKDFLGYNVAERKFVMDDPSKSVPKKLR